MRSPAELTDAFRARGLKITPQRQAVFRILYGNQSHPTAEAVYAAAVAEMPAISLRTIYQTLNDLAAMGEVQSVDLGAGPVRFDPLVEEHHHLVCEGCGSLRDVFVDGVDGLRPGGDLGGFAITSTDVVFRGRCARCQQAAPDPSIHPPHDHGAHRHG